MKRWLGAAFVAASLAFTVPALAQPAGEAPALSSADRVEAFAALPYWPGYWVSEQYANTTIGGFAAPLDAGSPPLQRLKAFNAAWN